MFYLKGVDGKITKRMNDLSGKEWLQYSFSIWRNLNKNSDDKKIDHPAIYPVSLAEKIIKIFTHEGDLIFDPFVGSGSTAIASMNQHRHFVGIELSLKYVKLSRSRINKKIKTNSNMYNPNVIHGDSRDIPKLLDQKSIDLCVTSPPYWNILNQKRSVDGKKIHKYSNSLDDLGNIINYDEFIDELKIIFKCVYKKLNLGKYCIIIVMDIRKKNKFYPLHVDIIHMMTKLGYEFDDLIIWDRQNEYNNMRPLGYPSVFRINKIHEFILIFRRL